MCFSKVKTWKLCKFPNMYVCCMLYFFHSALFSDHFIFTKLLWKRKWWSNFTYILKSINFVWYWHQFWTKTSWGQMVSSYCVFELIRLIISHPRAYFLIINLFISLCWNFYDTVPAGLPWFWLIGNKTQSVIIQKDPELGLYSKWFKNSIKFRFM